MHYAVNNKVLAPVDQWHLNQQSCATDKYACISVLGIYLIARCNSRYKTCSADVHNKVIHFNIYSRFFSD